MSGCLVPRNTAPNIAWPCCTQGRQAQSPRAAHEAVATESSSPQQEAGAVDELAAEVDLASLLRQTPCTLAGEAAGCTTLTLRLAYLLLCGVGRKQIQVEVGRPYGNANRGKDRRYSGWLAQGTQSWSWECSAACTSASAFTRSPGCGLWQTSRTWACRTAGQARPPARVGTSSLVLSLQKRRAD